MFVLLSFGLVLIATVLLVLGLLSDSGLVLIYLSIACSVVAGVLLIVATRMSRSDSTPAAAGSTPDLSPARDVEPVVVDVAPDPVTTSVPEPASFAPAAATEPPEDPDFFPIADYDELDAVQILPLLPELYADEIDVVDERERLGHARPEVLTRLAELRELLKDAPADATASSLGSSKPTLAAGSTFAENAAAATTTSARKRTTGTSATKARTTKSAATKATTTKVAAKKVTTGATKAAPAKKAPAKKVPAKKAAAPAKAVKKAAPAAAKKVAPAKKVATKAAAPAKAPAKKAPAKKATKATKKA